MGAGYIDLIEYICDNLSEEEKARLLAESVDGSLQREVKYGGLTMYEKLDWYGRAVEAGIKVKYDICDKEYYTDKTTKEDIYWELLEMKEEEAKYYLENKESIVESIITSRAVKACIPNELYESFVNDYVSYHAEDAYPGALQVIDILFKIVDGILFVGNADEYVARYNEFNDTRKMWVRRCIEKYFSPEYKKIFLIEIGLENSVNILAELFKNIVIPHCIASDNVLNYARNLTSDRTDLNKLRNYFFIVSCAEALYRKNNQLDYINYDTSYFTRRFNGFDVDTQNCCKEFIKNYFNEEYQKILYEGLGLGEEKKS